MRRCTYVWACRLMLVVVASVWASSPAQGDFLTVVGGSFLRTTGVYQITSGSATPIFVDNIVTPFVPPSLSTPYSNSSNVQGHAAISSTAIASVFNGPDYATLSADVRTHSENTNVGAVPLTFTQYETTAFINFTVPANTPYRINLQLDANGVFGGHLAGNTGNSILVNCTLGGIGLTTEGDTLRLINTVSYSELLSYSGVLQGGSYSLTVQISAASGEDPTIIGSTATTDLHASAFLAVGDVAAVPEPSSILLCSIGAVLLAVAGRRRRSAELVGD